MCFTPKNADPERHPEVRTPIIRYYSACFAGSCDPTQKPMASLGFQVTCGQFREAREDEEHQPHQFQSIRPERRDSEGHRQESPGHGVARHGGPVRGPGIQPTASGRTRKARYQL